MTAVPAIDLGRPAPLPASELAVAAQAADAAVTAGARVVVAGRETRIPGSKSGGECVTDVDLQAEAEIRKVLAVLTPDADVLGEELGGDPAMRHGWVIDPLDGTDNYCRRSPLCGVQVAFVADGRPLASAIDLPFVGERYRSTAGEGAHRDGAPLQASQARALWDAHVCLDLGGSPLPPAGPVVAALATTCGRVSDIGSSAVALAWVAAGVLDAAILRGNLAWDVLPGTLMVREAGGTVVEAPQVARGVGTWTVACGPGLAHSLVRLLQTGS